MNIKNIVKKCPKCGTIFNLSKREKRILSIVNRATSPLTSKDLKKLLKVKSLPLLYPALHSLKELGLISTEWKKRKHGYEFEIFRKK